MKSSQHKELFSVALRCSEAGLNALGWTSDGEDSDLSTLLVWGSGGPGFALRAFAQHPGSDPIDAHGDALAAYLRVALARDAFVDAVHTPWSLPTFDLVGAARRTGMGVAGRLGILMHPTFGPWWGLRIAIEVRAPSRAWRDALLEAMEEAHIVVTSGEQAPANPCLTCIERPCAAACPASAVSSEEARPDKEGAPFEPAFALMTCVKHVQSGGCPLRCSARQVCPAGKEHRYPGKVHAHHHSSFVRTLREWEG